jgi:hypothetical protein
MSGNYAKVLIPLSSYMRLAIKMPIKYFEISSIDARRFSKPGEKHVNVRVDHNSSVTMITEINNREANVDFRFTANYAGLGVIKFEGRIVFEGDAPAIAKQWSKENKMPDDVANEIHGVIMNNCLPEAVLIARDIRLPPPIPMPQVRVGKQGQAQPSSGVEVG